MKEKVLGKVNKKKWKKSGRRWVGRVEKSEEASNQPPRRGGIRGTCTVCAITMYFFV